MTRMRTMAGIIAGFAMSAMHAETSGRNFKTVSKQYKAIDGSKPTKKRMKVKLSRKANLQRMKYEK